MTWHECLSLIELIELKETGTTRHAQHVEDCPRCDALLRSLVVPEIPEPTSAQEIVVPYSRDQPETIEVMPGTIWTTKPDQLGFREVVAVVARSRRDPRLVVVAPISERTEEATDLDLSVDLATLGYPALVAVWNHGWIYDDQLDVSVAALEQRLRDELTTLYLWLMGGGERPTLENVAGPPIPNASDARNLRRDEERERLQALWRLVSRDQEPEREDDETRLVAALEPTFGALIGSFLASDEWDEMTLAEQATMGRSDLRRIVDDELDLTPLVAEARRVALLGKVLELELGEIKKPLHLSLARAQGGEPVGGNYYRAAARATTGAQDEQILHDLRTDHIDTSDEARARRIDEFWRTVVELYDDLS